MKDTTGLFVEAFGGDSRKEQGTNRGLPQGPDARAQHFQAAFGQPARAALPEPHLGQSWRFDMTKVSKLSFEEKYSLADLRDIPYRDLPAWVRDGKYAVASQEETKHQKEAFSATGLTQTERNVVFDQAQADAEALAAMTQSELLRDSAVLDGEIAAMEARYGSEMISMLSDVNPEAASYINARQKTKAAERKAQEQINQETASKDDVAAEIKAAQEAIAAMGGNPLVADSVARGSEVS